MANFGDILSSLAIGAGQGVRRNAADTGFEAYTITNPTGLWNDRGSYNASGGTYPSSGGSGTAGAIMKGDIWTISVAGTLSVGAVSVGDVLRALVDTPGSTAGNWAVSEGNLGYTPENNVNKAVAIIGSQTSDTFYPSTKAVYEHVSRSPGFTWWGSRTTQSVGAETMLELPVSLDFNLDTAAGVASGSTAANAHVKSWTFYIDTVAFAVISFEEQLTKWRFQYEIIRRNALEATYSGVFTAYTSLGVALVRTFSGTISSGIDLASKPNAIKIEMETPDAAGDATLESAICETLNSPPATMVTSSRWAYFEADSYSQSDGSNIVTNWSDLSGNGRHATLVGSPTFEVGEINGGESPIIRLGADSSDAFTLPSMSGFTAGTIFIVQKVTNTGTSGGHAFGTGTAGHYPYSVDGKIYDGFGSTARKDTLTSKITLLNTWHVMHAWSGSSNWALFQNGTKVHSTTTNTVGFSSTPAIGTNGAGNYMKVDIAAIYIYSAVLSAANIEKQLLYIRKKWGVG